MPEDQSEEEPGLEDLCQKAEQGIKAAKSALCNRCQCQGLAMALSNLVSYIACISLFFSPQSRSIPFRSVIGELVRSVDAAKRLASGYANPKQWLSLAMVSQENPLGFLAAVEEIHTYIGMMNRILGSSEIINELGTKCEADNAVVVRFLQEAANRDRKQLKAIILEEMKYLIVFSSMKKLRYIKLLYKLTGPPQEVFRIEGKELKVFRSEKLGQGSAGTVYKGEYLGIPVAVKEAPSDDKHLRDERGVMVGLGASHPNIVRIFGVLEGGENTYLVMELMERNLQEFIKVKKHSFIEKLDILLQIASGVLFLHQNEVCYRDLKPENVLVKVEGRICIKLVDFGHSKSGFRSYNLHSVPVGTVAYMAPEILLNDNTDERNYTKKTDTFSFAIAAAEILTERLHFRGVRMTELYSLYKDGKRPPLPKNCPLRLKNLLKRCWMFLAQDRPSFNEIYSELLIVKEECLTGSSITALALPTVPLRRVHTHSPESSASPIVPIQRAASSCSSQACSSSSSLEQLAQDVEQRGGVPNHTSSEAPELLPALSNYSSPEILEASSDNEQCPASTTMGQLLQVEVSPNGDLQPIVPRRPLQIHGEVSSPASSSSATQWSSFESSSPTTPKMSPGLFDLKIIGECKVGSKLRAVWKFGVGWDSCVIQWGRCYDSREPEFLDKRTEAVTSSEHILSPDDYGARMCITCLPLAGNLQTGEPTTFKHDNPVLLVDKEQIKMNKFLEDGLARFNVKIDRDMISGRLELNKTEYYLWWSMSSMKNFREKYIAEGVAIRISDEDPKVCELTRSTGKSYRLTFKDGYKRNLAVLTMRHFMEACVQS